MIIMNKEYPQPTGLDCPITGAPLLCTGHEMWVMDGSTFYSPEGHPEIRYERHPFCWNLFDAGNRIFKLDGDVWTEMKRVPHSNKLFPIDTPEDDTEYLEALEEGEKTRKHNEELHKYWDEHPEEDPRVHAHCVGLDKVEVSPMKLPSCNLLYMDFKYSSKDN